MGLGSILILALALAADAFGVGISVGLTCRAPRQIFRLSWHFGLFQALMPAAGALAGVLLRELVQTYAPYVAALLLAAIGLKMLWESAHQKPEKECPDPTKGWSLLGLSLAVSIDAFVAGIGMVMLNAPLLSACLIIGLITGLATVFAMLNGAWLRKALGIWAERVGGAMLLLLAVRALFL